MYKKFNELTKEEIDIVKLNIMEDRRKTGNCNYTDVYYYDNFLPENQKIKSTSKKYTILKDDTRELYRIKALRDFADVKKGDLGGLIEREENLSQEGNCWIYYASEVNGNATVTDNAIIIGNSRISGESVVSGNAIVRNSIVKDNAIVSKNAYVECGKVYENAIITGNAKIINKEEFSSSLYYISLIFGNAYICGNAMIEGTVIISEKSIIKDNAVVIGLIEGNDNRETSTPLTIKGHSTIFDNAKVIGKCNIGGNSWIGENAIVKDWSTVTDNAVIRGNAMVIARNDISVNCNIFDNAIVNNSKLKNITLKENVVADGLDLDKNANFVTLKGNAMATIDKNFFLRNKEK